MTAVRPCVRADAANSEPVSSALTTSSSAWVRSKCGRFSDFTTSTHEYADGLIDSTRPFGYGHLLIFAPLAAMGAGVHVAAYALAGEAEIGATGTVLSVVIPFAIFAAAFYGLCSALMRTSDPFHLWLLTGTAAVLVLALILASAGVSVPVCLLVVMLAPVVTVVGYETIGHRHMADAVRRL